MSNTWIKRKIIPDIATTVLIVFEYIIETKLSFGKLYFGPQKMVQTTVLVLDDGERSVYNLFGPCYTYNQLKEEASLVW